FGCDTPGEMHVEMRREIFRHFAATGAPPVLPRSALSELAAEHAVVLDDPGRISFANPFATSPAAYPLTADGRSYSAVCAWDALGILAALGTDGDAEGRCPDCDGPLALSVRSDELAGSDCVVHFLVPAAHWYDELPFT